MTYFASCNCVAGLGDFAVFQGRLTSVDPLNTTRYGLASQVVLPGTSIGNVGDRGTGWGSMRGKSTSYFVYFPSSTELGGTYKYNRLTDAVTSQLNLPVTGYASANPGASGMSVSLGRGVFTNRTSIPGLAVMEYDVATDTASVVGTLVRGAPPGSAQSVSYTTSLPTSGNLYQVGSSDSDVDPVNRLVVSSWSFGSRTYQAQQALLGAARCNAGGIAGTIYGYVLGGTQGWSYSGVWYNSSLRFTYDTNTLVAFTSLAGTRAFSWGVSGSQTGTPYGVINTPWPASGTDTLQAYQLNLNTETLTQSSIMSTSASASYWCGA